MQEVALQQPFKAMWLRFDHSSNVCQKRQRLPLLSHRRAAKLLDTNLASQVPRNTSLVVAGCAGPFLTLISIIAD